MNIEDLNRMKDSLMILKTRLQLESSEIQKEISKLKTKLYWKKDGIKVIQDILEEIKIDNIDTL